MSLADFWACSLWEFGCAVEGWNRSQGAAEKAAPPSDEEFAAMKAAHGD